MLPGDDVEELVTEHSLMGLFWVLVGGHELHCVLQAVHVASVRQGEENKHTSRLPSFGDGGFSLFACSDRGRKPFSPEERGVWVQHMQCSLTSKHGVELQGMQACLLNAATLKEIRRKPPRQSKLER